MKKSDSVMEMLRQRRGLDTDDESQDERLRQYTPMAALEECCAWQLGDYRWADWFTFTMFGCGFNVTENPVEMKEDK